MKMTKRGHLFFIFSYLGLFNLLFLKYVCKQHFGINGFSGFLILFVDWSFNSNYVNEEYNSSCMPGISSSFLACLGPPKDKIKTYLTLFSVDLFRLRGLISTLRPSILRTGFSEYGACGQWIERARFELIYRQVQKLPRKLCIVNNAVFLHPCRQCHV